MDQTSRDEPRPETTVIPSLDWKAAATIFVLTLIAYARCHNNSFINLDDPAYITDNPLVKKLSWSHLYSIWTNVGVRPYYPTVFTLYSIEYALFGNNAAGFHSVNIVLHALNAVLAYVLVLRLLRSHTVGLVTGLLVGLHPMHVSAVAWASNSKEILSCLFVLLTLIAYHWYATVGRRRFYALSLALYTLALLSKVTSALLPLLLLIIDYEMRRRDRMLVVLEKVPFVHIAIIFGFLTWQTHAVEPALANTGSSVSYYSSINAIGALGFYILKIIWPVGLTVLYPSEYSAGAMGLMVFGTVAFVAATVWILMLSRNYGFGLAWFGLLAAPVLGFVPFPYVVSVAPFADHFNYLVDIGLFVVIGLIVRWLLNRAGPRKRRVAALWTIALIGAVLSLQTSQRANVFQNSETFWRDAVRINDSPNSSIGHQWLAVTLRDMGDLDEALYHAQIAEDRSPENRRAGELIEQLKLQIEKLPDQAPPRAAPPGGG